MILSFYRPNNVILTSIPVGKIAKKKTEGVRFC